MSAVEALAEDLWMQHQEHFQTDSPWYDPKRGILRILQGIPSMPAEQVAELIGGTVQNSCDCMTCRVGCDQRVVGKWFTPTNGEQK